MEESGFIHTGERTSSSRLLERTSSSRILDRTSLSLLDTTDRSSEQDPGAGGIILHHPFGTTGSLKNMERFGDF